VWTRAETAGAMDQRIAPDQVLGRVVRIRKRGLREAASIILRGALNPQLHRWARRLQGLAAYRALVRPLVVPGLSYHLGLARGALRYEWLDLGTAGRAPILPRTSRPHVLVAKRRRMAAGWSVLAFRDSAWRCESLYVRLRYRGLGVESELHRLSRLLLEAR